MGLNFFAWLKSLFFSLTYFPARTPDSAEFCDHWLMEYSYIVLKINKRKFYEITER